MSEPVVVLEHRGQVGVHKPLRVKDVHEAVMLLKAPQHALLEIIDSGLDDSALILQLSWAGQNLDA